MHGNSLIPTAEEHDWYWDGPKLGSQGEWREAFDYLVDHLDVESDVAEGIADDYTRYELECMTALERLVVIQAAD